MNRAINHLLEQVLAELSEAEKVLIADVEDLQEIEDEVKRLIRVAYGGQAPSSMEYKRIASRCPLPVARIRSLIKRYPRTVAEWFGGKSLEFEGARAARGGGDYVKPFTPVARRSRSRAAGFSIVR